MGTSLKATRGSSLKAIKSSWALALLLGAAAGILPCFALPDAFEKGVKAYNQRDYRQALELFERATQKAPGDVNSFYYQALCHTQLGQYDRARAVYSLILTRFPDSSAAQHARTALSAPSSVRGVRRYAIFSTGQQAVLTPSRGQTSDNPGRRAARPERNTDRPGTRMPRVDREVFSGGGTLIAPDRCRVYYELRNNSFYLNGQVNGRPMEFVFDTGASTTYLGKNQLNQLGIKAPEGNIAGYSAGVGGSGAVPIWRHKVDLKVGPIERRDFEISVSPHADVALLGQTFFRDFQYTIDRADNSIVLERKSGAGTYADRDVHDRYAVPFRVEKNEIVVTAQVNGHPYDMFFDTGATATCFSYNDLKRLNIRMPDDAEIGVAHGIGGATAMMSFPIHSLKLGPIEKYNFKVSVVATPVPRPLMGQSFFGDYKYTIDNENRLIRFTRR